MEAIWQERSGDYPWKWEKWECNIDLREPKLKVEVVNVADCGQMSYQRCTRCLQLTYPSGLKTSKRLSVQFLQEPAMYESGDPDGIDKTMISNMSRIINAIEACIRKQSGIPTQFWHSGGSGIATEPGSIVKAGN